MKRETPQVLSNGLLNQDKYILKSGKWFSKLSIDELPKLINILKGELNFIGPCRFLLWFAIGRRVIW